MLTHSFNLTYTDDGQDHPCIATIAVLKFDPPNLYASWKVTLADGGSAVASKSREFFVGDKMPDDTGIIRLIKEDLKKYRIGRAYVFKDLE